MSWLESIRVLVADDESALRHAVAELIEAEEGLVLAGCACDAGEALALARRTKPDVAIVDVRMPGGGPEAARSIAEASPGTHVLALSAYADRDTVMEMFGAGAIGYLVKGVPPEEIVDAIRRAARGQASLSAPMMDELLDQLAGDTAERRDAEQVLRRSEQRLRRLIDSAPDAVVVVRDDGTIVLVNRQTEELFGYTRDELLGGKIEQLVPTRYQDRHLGHREGFFRDPRPRRLGAGPELTGRRKDGTEFPVDISLSALETEDGVLATAFVREMSETAQADTARRRTEERLSTLLEAASDAAIVTNDSGAIVYVNRQTEVRFDYDRSELIGEKLELLVPERFGDGGLSEVTGRRKDGSEFPVEISRVAFETRDGRHLTHFVRSATERLAPTDLQRHLVERRRLVARVVRASEEERARIASDIHDDTVQAMTAVGLRLGLLRRRLGESADLQAFDQLEESVRNSIARLRHLIFELRPPELDREGLVPALRVRLDQLKDEHGLDYALEDALQREPEAETKTIAYRIVQEALTNTRKHAEASRVEIGLETHGIGLFGSVRDDGLGFSPDQLAARRKLGHLGVVAMRERAEVAGGWLRVESAPGEGTRVEFWIPDARASTDESEDEAAA